MEAAHRAAEDLQDAAVEGDGAVLIKLDFKHSITVSPLEEKSPRKCHVWRGSVLLPLRAATLGRDRTKEEFMNTSRPTLRAIITGGVAAVIALAPAAALGIGVATAAPAAATTDSTNPGGGSGHHFAWNGGVGDPSKSWGLVVGTLSHRLGGPTRPVSPLPPGVLSVGGSDGNLPPAGGGGNGTVLWGCGDPGC